MQPYLPLSLFFDSPLSLFLWDESVIHSAIETSEQRQAKGIREICLCEMGFPTVLLRCFPARFRVLQNFLNDYNCRLAVSVICRRP